MMNLLYLVAPGATLVEEARIALSKVLDMRDLKNIETEIKSTVEDLNSQAKFESELTQQKQKLQRSIRKHSTRSVHSSSSWVLDY
jgi:hypothetical protein